jgi:hypothetical protein
MEINQTGRQVAFTLEGEYFFEGKGSISGNKMALTDALFHNYEARGLSSRKDAIISKKERDTDSLTCDGDQFVDRGHLKNWIFLK